jgi:hypothetical protein
MNTQAPFIATHVSHTSHTDDQTATATVNQARTHVVATKFDIVHKMCNTPADIHFQLFLLSESMENKIHHLANRLQRRASTEDLYITHHPSLFPSDIMLCEQCRMDSLYDAVMKTRQALEDSIQQIHKEMDSKKRRKY